ncbi:hypothetical protein N7448_001516 [Penicillium atrosanguineum]|uniref:Uncharacterized protein n=1 Tax=Penicillium atrosanguineum TaxID=1132637 RepID=A0A9W9LC57_9EURO|nr:hypothetical protein N7448_001516 [Penicillium atrosanguineum]KAJ5324718.1 hypothetical protein N7476_003318 [Penicillium atrosanguineum]
MTRPYDPLIHIPPFVKPVAPYVKPRQEALRIRQALTLYLRSLIVFDDANLPNHTQSHLALCAPTDAIADVKPIPADLTGLRKEYLQALQANVAARKGLRAVSEDVASLRRQRTPATRPAEFAEPQETGADLRDYLLLLRDRRRHAKLQVFQDYLEQLEGKKEIELKGIGAGEDQSPQLLPKGLEADVSGRSDTDTDLEALVHKLERAVLRSRKQLDREKQLFEKIKAQHGSRGSAASGEISAAMKARALQRTRDELVQWVEERLIIEGDPDESIVQDLPPEEIEEAQRVLEHQKMQIAEQYTAYLHARRDLLEAASRACQPVTVTSKPPTRPVRTEFASEEVQPPNGLDVVSYAADNLVPLSKSQKALALQKSYLSGLLAKEKSTTLRTLNRLSHESHLLPEYPILARQPRFKHAVAALNSRTSPQSDQTPPDEVVSLAEAWAFASNAAGGHERDYVQQKIILGNEVAQDARRTLEDVYGTLNQDLNEVIGEAEPELASDIWASEARSTRGVTNATAARLEKRPRGPWSGLNGRVGVE